MAEKFDFSGWATKNDIKCADGRTIRKNAFKDNDGQVVPLVWMHNHKDVDNVLGHALLENRDEGVYAYCTLNETPAGQNAKILIEHGDVNSLSIYANQLKQKAGDVLHGIIKEVSLVLAGANPGAVIDFPMIEHSDELDYEEAIIYNDMEDLFVSHAEDDKELEKEEEEENDMASEKTVKDVFDELTEEQKQVVYYMIGAAIDQKNGGGSGEEDEEDMKHNIFESDEPENTLTHADEEMIISDAKRFGSLKESFMQHAAEYGIEDIDWLFPEAKNLNTPPEFIQRDMGWVKRVMAAVHHTPFSRIKSMQADITEDAARAKGYLKGHKKKDEVFTLLRRTTDPQTVYKKQKLDRDDVVDITDFDVVSWLKSEMRMMLDEELARAVLIGDGRLSSSEDKISELHIRSIWNDDVLYAPKYVVDPGNNKAKALIRSIIKNRKDYKGSGNPVMFTTEDMLAEMLLIEDGIGHYLYTNESALATTLRVKEIITVPVMAEITTPRHDVTANKDYMPLAIIVNLSDYNIGADKGGAVSMFDDFDIDYNQMKYLIETRCSGALIKPKSAQIFEEEYVNP